MITRRRAVLALSSIGAALAVPNIVCGQTSPRIPRVAILFGGSPESDGGLRRAFSQGLREHGYIEGKNILIDDLFTNERNDQLTALLGEVIRRNPAVIVVQGSQAVSAAKAATSTIPIVMASVGNPDAKGFVSSIARPGGNITGIAILAEVLVAKRVELIAEVLPKTKRIGYLAHPDPLFASPTMLGSFREATKRVGADAVEFYAGTPAELDETLKRITKQKVDALVVGQISLMYSLRKNIVAALARSGIPASFGNSESVVDGGLMSYAANFNDNYRQVAGFVHRILNGAKPGDLPVEQPTKFELAINLATAKTLGIKVPQSVLVRADRVIE